MSVNDHVVHLDRRIASKREQIAAVARDVISSMEVLIRDAAAGHVRETPIQGTACALNTLCGELTAMIEARAILAHALQVRP